MKKTFSLGIIAGLVFGVLLAAGMAVYATWSDPTSAPPTGGTLRVNTTGSPPGNPNCSEGGLLHFDDGSGLLYVCDGSNWDQLN